MTKTIQCLGGVIFLFLTNTLYANNAKIDGLWQATYAASNTPSSHIEITTLANGEVQGVIKIAYPRPGVTHASPNCEKCSGANKDKPIVGMQVLWGEMPAGKNKWSGGTVLDPEEGKEYKANLTLSDDGNTISVRGFILTPSIGQTVTWIRIK